jgi:hypothetical protein
MFIVFNGITLLLEHAETPMATGAIGVSRHGMLGDTTIPEALLCFRHTGDTKIRSLLSRDCNAVRGTNENARIFAYPPYLKLVPGRVLPGLILPH